jgi:hypothetical protein
MEKISTLFKKDPTNLGRVINEINPENKWVFDGEGIPTQKFDGTSASVINGEIYKRYDAKKGRQVPDGAIPCQDADLITGHHPHWVKCSLFKKEDKYFFEGFNSHLQFFGEVNDGTYELVGEKVNNNHEKVGGHLLMRHGSIVLNDLIEPFTFDSLKEYLEYVDIEGIVFHHKSDGRMCKLRKSDFGIKR